MQRIDVWHGCESYVPISTKWGHRRRRTRTPAIIIGYTTSLLRRDRLLPGVVADTGPRMSAIPIQQHTDTWYRYRFTISSSSTWAQQDIVHDTHDTQDTHDIHRLMKLVLTCWNTSPEQPELTLTSPREIYKKIIVIYISRIVFKNMKKKQMFEEWYLCDADCSFVTSDIYLQLVLMKCCCFLFVFFLFFFFIMVKKMRNNTSHISTQSCQQKKKTKQNTRGKGKKTVKKAKKAKKNSHAFTLAPAQKKRKRKRK